MHFINVMIHGGLESVVVLEIGKLSIKRSIFHKTFSLNELLLIPASHRIINVFLFN